MSKNLSAKERERGKMVFLHTFPYALSPPQGLQESGSNPEMVLRRSRPTCPTCEHHPSPTQPSAAHNLAALSRKIFLVLLALYCDLIQIVAIELPTAVCRFSHLTHLISSGSADRQHSNYCSTGPTVQVVFDHLGLM